MIEYILFIALFVFLQDNECYQQKPAQCKRNHTPYVSPDFVQNDVQKSVIDPTPNEEPIQEPIQEPIHEPIQEPIQETIQEPIQEPIQETIQEPIQETIQEPIQETAEEFQSSDFEPLYIDFVPANNSVYLQDIERGVLVEAYDLRLSLFPKNKTDVHEENNSITIEMKNNNFIFQIYS